MAKRGKTGLFFDLLVGMTLKELRARYKYTILGFFWLVINPVLQMAVIGFIFTYFMREPIKNYYYFLFSGLLVWNFFSISLAKATPSIVFERTLIKKANFPREIIPLSIIFSNLVHMVLAFLLFLIPLSFVGTLSLLRIPFLLLGILLLLAWTIGFSLLSSALNVRYRDINFFVQALLIVWFYATPVVYSLSIIPVQMRWLWDLNPLTSVVQLFQYSLLGSAYPDAGTLSSNIGIILFVLAIGTWIFRKESRDFDDWI